MNEFIPIQHFYRIVRLWWVVVLAVLLGGGMGFIVHLFRPAVYEATASIYVSIDFDKVESDTLTQYDKDLVLSIVQQTFFTPEVREAMIGSTEYQSAGLDIHEWNRSVSVEREHAIWKIRVQHTNPKFAQVLVNKWAQLGYQHLSYLQEKGEIPDYVLLESPIPAELPLKPTNFGRNQLVLAGCLIGFIIGSMISDWLGWRLNKSGEFVSDKHRDHK